MDQEVAFQRIWQAFRAAKTLEPGPGSLLPDALSAPFAKVVIRAPLAALSRQFMDCAREFATLPFVALTSPDQLSITLQELGYLALVPSAMNEITESRLEEFATAAASPISQQEPFEIVLNGANSFQDAAFLQVLDCDRCAKVHARLFELAAIPKSPDFPYIPVATFATYTSMAATYVVVDRLNRWRDVEFARFEATNVEIVLERRTGLETVTETYAVIPLGSG